MAGFVRVQPWHDTAAGWLAADPILRAGEVGYETDTGLIKRGDGSSVWSALPYALTESGADAAVASLMDTDSSTREKMDDRYRITLRSQQDEMRAARDRAYRTWYAIPNLMIYGHSVVAGTGASDQPHTFGRLLKSRIERAHPGAVVNIKGLAGYNTTELLAAGLPAEFTGMAAGSCGGLLLMCLLNDYSEGIDPATTKTNLQSIIAAFRANAAAAPNMSVLIAVEWLRTTASGGWTWDQYVNVAQQVADADENTTVVDLGARIGTASADTLSLFSDGTHPTDRGHALIASLLYGDLERAPRPAYSPHTIIPAIVPAIAQTSWPHNPSPLAGASAYGNWNISSDGTQGASITYQWLGDEGYYDIGIAYQASTVNGQYDVYIDGVLQGSGATWDGYGAAVSYKYSHATNFAVKGSGLHTLKLVMASKNASSTGYKGVLNAVTITRVGDLTS